MLKKAKKRCQAIPMVRLLAMTINQAIEVIILIAATITIAFSIAAVLQLLKKTTAGQESA